VTKSSTGDAQLANVGSVGPNADGQILQNVCYRSINPAEKIELPGDKCPVHHLGRMK